jgi:hypothetical protein
MASLDKWDDYTRAKEAMFLHTDTSRRAVDGDQERLQEARAPERHALPAAPLPYTNKDHVEERHHAVERRGLGGRASDMRLGGGKGLVVRRGRGHRCALDGARFDRAPRVSV